MVCRAASGEWRARSQRSRSARSVGHVLDVPPEPTEPTEPVACCQLSAALVTRRSAALLSSTRLEYFHSFLLSTPLSPLRTLFLEVTLSAFQPSDSDAPGTF